MGVVMSLCLERRGVNVKFTYPTPKRIEITAEMPLAEIIYDFFTTKIGVYIYNKAIEDACILMNEKVEELYTLEKKSR